MRTVPTPSVGSIDASGIVSGTVDTARLGSGTADATTYLRGDQTWFTPSGASLADGDYGDITVSGTGTVMTLDSSATAKVLAIVEMRA